MNLGEAPSVANFGERWPLACFCAFKPLFWLIKWWRFKDLVRREANLWKGAILSPVPGEGGLQPIRCCQTARSGEGRFSDCVARLFFWPCLQVVFLAVSPGCFWLVSPGFVF